MRRIQQTKVPDGHYNSENVMMHTISVQ